MEIDLSPLIKAVIQQLTMIVPALGGLAIAWIGRKAYMISMVKREAVEAEKVVGPGNGETKHTRVKANLSRTFTGRTFSSDQIDELIRTSGRRAAHEYRESTIPPPPKVPQ